MRDWKEVSKRLERSSESKEKPRTEKLQRDKGEKVLRKEQCPYEWVLSLILPSNDISYKTVCSICYHLCNKLCMPEYFKKNV